MCVRKAIASAAPVCVGGGRGAASGEQRRGRDHGRDRRGEYDAASHIGSLSPGDAAGRSARYPGSRGGREAPVRHDHRTDQTRDAPGGCVGSERVFRVPAMRQSVAISVTWQRMSERGEDRQGTAAERLWRHRGLEPLAHEGTVSRVASVVLAQVAFAPRGESRWLPAGPLTGQSGVESGEPLVGDSSFIDRRSCYSLLRRWGRWVSSISFSADLITRRCHDRLTGFLIG